VKLLFAAALACAAVAHAAIPTPESHFGHKMGEDRKLIEWAKTVSYFEALDKASDGIVVRKLGKTTGGRDFIAAWISSPANLKKLDRYREIQRRLADPRKTAEAEAAKLIAEGKALVMITCSIHSTEVASTLTAVDFAHRMLTEDRAKFRAILDNVIFILVPSLNPDGVDIVRDWYLKTLGTPYEGTAPPELYQKYVGHDDNRDWYIFSQAETRLAISQLHNVWHPQIVYDVHQQGATASRMFFPPWLDPIEPNMDPILVQLCNMVGTGMAADLTAAGKKGVTINSIYDFWTPARNYQGYHGGLRILSESASVRLASPVNIKPEEISESALGYNPRESSWNHLEPWLGGEWRLRDIIEYQELAWESCLWQAAVRREDFLKAFYAVGTKAVARTSPHAFVLNAKQRDRGALRKLLETLAFGMVEIEKAETAFAAAGKEYPAGSYVIRMQQPYSSFAKALLEKQTYPDLRQYPGGPPRRPYDVTAHTLPMLMGVESEAVYSPFPAKLTPVSAFDDLPKPAPPHLAEIQRRRIGIFKSFQPAMDEGWTRWIFEQMGVPFTSVRNADITAGQLRTKYDVLVFPDQGPAAINFGYRPGTMPPEYTGGIGDAGARALTEFAQQGGTLLFFNDSSAFGIGHMGVPVRNALRGIPSRDFYCPGSLLNVTLDTAHPLSNGLPADLPIWFEESPAFEIPAGSPARAVAKYPAADLLASGWLLGEKHLATRAALVEVPMGKGRVILFGMRPQYRAQSYLTMNFIWNALLLAEPAR
jgi:hypothetical protein